MAEEGSKYQRGFVVHTSVGDEPETIHNARSFGFKNGFLEIEQKNEDGVTKWSFNQDYIVAWAEFDMVDRKARPAAAKLQAVKGDVA